MHKRLWQYPGRDQAAQRACCNQGPLLARALLCVMTVLLVCLMHTGSSIALLATLPFSALFMARSLTRDQLNDFRVWLHSLNMDSLVRVAEVLDDLMADREMQQREAAAALQSQWQFVNPEPDLEQPGEAASSSSQRQPETS